MVDDLRDNPVRNGRSGPENKAEPPPLRVGAHELEHGAGVGAFADQARLVG